MANPPIIKKELMDDIVNRKNMGDKKFHSETSLQQFGGDEESTPEVFKDPGVQNMSVYGGSNSYDSQTRRRTMSQPGPGSGGMLTATAARAARKRPQRNVIYAPNVERSIESDSVSLMLPFPNKGDDSGTATPIESFRLYAPMNDMRGGATPRKRSVGTMDAQSLRSIETQAPPPTSPEDNKKQTAKYLTLVISSMYAILLVTLGLIINIADVFVEHPISTIYLLIISGLGFLYHLYLLIDIGRYKRIALKNLRIKAKYEEKIADYFRKNEEEYALSIPGDQTPELYKPPGIPPPVLIPLKHKYCFSQGRHSGSFYLKMGAAVFALGHVVHTILLITVQVGNFFDTNIDNDECVEIARVALDVFNPIFCFLQLYFVFKYSNVIILQAQGLAHFGFMHMIGSSLCFWISAIVRETILALTLYAQSIYGDDDYNQNSNETASIIDVYSEGSNHIINVDTFYRKNCSGNPAMSTIYERFSPYLFPFSVEFNILVVAVYYIIWSNIGHCRNEYNNNSESVEEESVCKIATASAENDFTSNLVIHADCHASNKGLFLGLIVIVVIAGMLIIGFVFSSVGGDFLEVGYILSDSTKLWLHSIMLFAVILALTQTKKLDINEHPISLLDDILLFVCLPPFFMETLFSLVATISILNIVKSIDFVIMLIQVLIQTPLIMDALRRCSNTKKLRRSKPGRELIMFLIITNVAMWVFYTFSYKSPDSLDERYSYYGKVLWTILGHVSLPLIMFYRFHSSVCFADIWDSAYKPGSEH